MTNALLADWDTPFEVPPFDAMADADFAPAMAVALEAGREAIAAIAWFSLVTVLMVRTKNVWDCVVAHAVTNLLLGIYVIWFEQWQLW